LSITFNIWNKSTRPRNHRLERVNLKLLQSGLFFTMCSLILTSPFRLNIDAPSERGAKENSVETDWR
jgi:hypothetical protein